MKTKLIDKESISTTRTSKNSSPFKTNIALKNATTTKKSKLTSNNGRGIQNLKLKQVLSVKQEISKIEANEILNNIISDHENDNLLDKINDAIVVIDKSNEIEKDDVGNLLKYVSGKSFKLLKQNVKMKVNQNEKNVEIIELNNKLYNQNRESENLQSEV